jgi:hypothetical protein
MMKQVLVRTIPSEFRFESQINLNSKYLNILSLIPVINLLTAALLKWSGRVSLRVWKVDSNMPDEYRFRGWKIRNKSTRADGVYYTSGNYVSLRNESGGEDLPRES